MHIHGVQSDDAGVTVALGGLHEVADGNQDSLQRQKQRAVHADASEFVDDEPQPPAGKLPGKIFEEGGFPCTQKTGDEIQFHYIAPFLAEKRL